MTERLPPGFVLDPVKPSVRGLRGAPSVKEDQSRTGRAGREKTQSSGGSRDKTLHSSLSQDNYQATPYSDEVVAKVGKMAPVIKGYSAKYGVPVLAVAGSIAEEYDTRSRKMGVKGFYDKYQDSMLRYTPKESDINRFAVGAWDSRIAPAYAGSSGFMHNDLGAANIKMATAARLAREFPDHFPAGIQEPQRLAAYVASDHGNAHLAAMYISQAQRGVNDFLKKAESPVSNDYRIALYVDYFRKGPETLGRQAIHDRLTRKYGLALTEKMLDGRGNIPKRDLPMAYYGSRVVANQQQIYNALGLEEITNDR